LELSADLHLQSGSKRANLHFRADAPLRMTVGCGDQAAGKLAWGEQFG